MFGDATGIYYGCLQARVRETGEFVRVRKTNPFDFDTIPEWEQVGDDGLIIRYFEHFELEF